MRLARFAPALLALAAAARCGVHLAPERPGRQVPIERFRPGRAPFTYYSDLHDSVRVVIRDSSHWRRYWSEIYRTTAPAPALPPVDFRRDVVVLAALGRRPSGGYSIVVDSAFASHRTLRIVVRRLVPGRGCVLTAARTAPVDVVLVLALPDSVVFIERQQVEPCE